MPSLVRVPPVSLPPALAGMALLNMAIGSVVLITGITLLTVPVMLLMGIVSGLCFGVFLGSWALIEALAAMEYWMEPDSSLQL